jgi:hypothetical protein
MVQAGKGNLKGRRKRKYLKSIPNQLLNAFLLKSFYENETISVFPVSVSHFNCQRPEKRPFSKRIFVTVWF